MFRSARIKLTAWYLLIIMVISGAFSIAVYNALTSELDRIERTQQFRIEHENREFGLNRPIPPYIDPIIINEAKNRVALFLGLLDLVILGVSALAGYWLAGKTLKPIQVMVKDQNRFIADASHELRTPLTALKAEIEVSLRDKKLTLWEAQHILSSNLEEVNKLQNLADSLIKLTQYNGKKQTVNEIVNLPEIMCEATNRVTKLAKLKKITITQKVAAITLVGDAQSLTELIVILLDNAIKYSPNGTTVKLRATATDKNVTIAVVDQGIGIETKNIPHLFDRFYRVDKSRTKDAVDGYGLGLSIAKQIAEDHAGSIQVASKPNNGSTFTIEIPIKLSA
jgi:two-component system, OmpR family, sensor histidine kinase CiaH